MNLTADSILPQTRAQLLAALPQGDEWVRGTWCIARFRAITKPYDANELVAIGLLRAMAKELLVHVEAHRDAAAALRRDAAATLQRAADAATATRQQEDAAANVRQQQISAATPYLDHQQQIRNRSPTQVSANAEADAEIAIIEAEFREQTVLPLDLGAAPWKPVVQLPKPICRETGPARSRCPICHSSDDAVVFLHTMSLQSQILG